MRGPSPATGPLSWDKSPVANGAHYFLFGRVDPSDPPGVLREKGFGVEFPNYIVDIKKDPDTGRYLFDSLQRTPVVLHNFYSAILMSCLVSIFVQEPTRKLFNFNVWKEVRLAAKVGSMLHGGKA